MHSRSSRSIPVVFLCTLLALAGSASAEMGGGEGRPTPFVGEVDLDDGSCRFSIDVDAINLLVTAVAGKYRLVRMRIDCRGEDDLALSVTGDELHMLVNEERVAAVLSLRQTDPGVWDAFDTDLRRKLAYPPLVSAGEPVYVFAYFPAGEVTSLPQGFELTLASLGETVRLQHLVAAARN
jgi:hypothetical protein